MTSALFARSEKSTRRSPGCPFVRESLGRKALKIVQQVRERLTLFTLSEREYVSALETASAKAIVGSAVYDLFIAHCALKAGAEILLTWNVRDFTRFGSAIAPLVKTPLEL